MSLAAFASLLERLAFTPQRSRKEELLAAAFASQPDPDRGLMLAALTGDLQLRQVTPSLLRGLAETRVDAQLFAASYDFVGDLAETIALIWPENGSETPSLSLVVTELAETPKTRLHGVIAARLDSLGPSERYAYLKLATGALRVGVSARLARSSFASWAGLPLAEVEEIWHALAPPYTELFAWGAGGPRPEAASRVPFRPVMLSTATDLEALSALDPADYTAEWKWDGIRVQAVSDGGLKRLIPARARISAQLFPM